MLRSKKDFAGLCGIKTKDLSVYILRNKVILSEGFIDDQIPHNILFMQKKRAEKKVTNKSTSEPIIKDTNPDLEAANAWNIEQQLKEANLEIKKSEIEIRRIQMEKLQGLLIPTELVLATIINLSEALKISFNEGSDNLIVVMGQKKQLSVSEIAEIRKELILIINNSLDKAVVVCKKNIRNIVKEYSEKKK